MVTDNGSSFIARRFARHVRTEARPDDEILPEYHFESGKGRPNRFAELVRPGSRVVVLDPDVAEFFTTTEQVNAHLRAVVATVPSQTSG